MDVTSSVELVAVLVVAALVVGVVIVARRPGSRPGGEVVVRCRDGHLFTTIWLPLVSFKAIRLGPVRFQYCPVGDHWTFVTPVRYSDLTERERRTAGRYRDGPVP